VKSVPHGFTPATIKRFWSHVQKSNPDNCWLWSAYRDKIGYGRFAIKQECGKYKSILAHRISFTLTSGTLPENLCVLHKCDNPPCVNPNHLFLGTLQDNIDDMVAKGRQSKGLSSGSYTKPESRTYGERNGCSKLTNEQITEMRERYIKGNVTQKLLGTEYGVDQSLISYIVNWKRWPHIP